MYAKIQRFLFGWIPISIGDIFYIVLIIIVVYKASIFFKLLFKRKFNRNILSLLCNRAFSFSVSFYVTFNLLWGLNYNRRGIAYQLNLEVRKYTTNDLDTLTTVLLERVNNYAASL
ncbi:MAG: DUF3810 family protein [Chitinophagaceae bacterium]|nr:DUF3810 family protein [Chitinophagaceae bacterium]